MDFYNGRRWVITDNRQHRYKIVHFVITNTRNELSSYSAFPSRKKIHPFFHTVSLDEWEQWYEPDYRRFDLIREEHYHTSLWDFYQYIGWDHRKKDWIRATSSVVRAPAS